MAELACGWSADVDRGPNWLFVRLHAPGELGQRADELAEHVWRLLQQHLTDRLVLDMSDLAALPSSLVGQLVKLHKRVESRGGLMRLSGLNDANQQVLRAARLDSRFPQYPDREAAVMGYRPRQPR